MSLVSILTQPKHALTQQYKYMFELDNVYLEFDDEALQAIASMAIQRETGARGLRAIVESFMTDIMYYIPRMKPLKKWSSRRIRLRKRETRRSFITRTQPIVRKTKRNPFKENFP